MAVGSNELVVTDAYASLTASGNPESEIPPNTPFFIVVKAEAGNEAWNNGIHFRLHVLLLDITDSYTNQLNQVIQGNLQNAPWTSQSNTFNLPVTSRGQDTIYRITTVLSSGISQTGLNVFESELFVVAD